MILLKLVVEEVKAELGPICWHRTTESTNRGGRKRLPNVNSSDDASAAASGFKIELVQQTVATDKPGNSVARARSFEAACRLATVRSRHTAPAQVSHVPNYNLRYAKRSTQKINAENIERRGRDAQLKNVISEWWLKSREAPHSHLSGRQSGKPRMKWSLPTCHTL